MPSSKVPLAAVFGCGGLVLSEPEREFFRAADPLGFILFKRNCADPEQVKSLVAALRDSVERADAPILIDQEGGRVARLQPPHWPIYPAPARIAGLGRKLADEAAFLVARLIADDLSVLGISIDCLPVLDLAIPGADPVIGDRAWGAEPESAARLGRANCDGLLEGGILPVIKHIPGHGRASVDSHRDLPRVLASLETLERTDFAAFRLLNGMPWAMTAHVIYTAIDPDLPATLSPRVIAAAIRGSIGFAGVLISDDLSMGALSGSLGSRTEAALTAGCDVVLHCNADMNEMSDVARTARPLTERTIERIGCGDELRAAPRAFDRAAATARLDRLMGT